jgi:nodulation protein Z
LDRRYVISIRRRTGLGDHLVCLAAAWRFARDTGRTLVADWRYSSYTLMRNDNLFPLCFEAPDELAGVPFIGGADVGTVSPQRADGTLGFAPFWRWNDLRRIPYRRALAHILASRDFATRKVVLDNCLNHAVTSVEDAAAFFRALRPVGAAADALATFCATLPPGPLIGLHMRHGNGQRIPGYEQHWASFPLAIERCVKAVDEARRQLGGQATVLLCTDFAPVEEAIRAQVPDVVTRHKMRREAGEGEQHLWRGASFIRDDALIEMLLLARCDALVRYPPASFFSLYGAVLKPSRRPPPANMQALQQPWDPADGLSPALLL